MFEYNFENMDAKLFEHLAVALGQEHVARGLRPFGAGPDGGREATFEGLMHYPSSAAPWDGYLVVQCKRKERRGSTPKEEADWAIDQLNTEMEKYTDAKVLRRLPEYFLFVTNAELSAKPIEGGKDRFVAALDDWVKKLGIQSADFWDREKLSRLLDGTQSVAQRFGLLHGGDLLHYAAQAVLNHRNGIEITLSLFLQEELRADQFVRLAQAGHVGDERTPLARVFVDLRATEKPSGGGGRLVVQAIQDASDRPIYASLLDTEFENDLKQQGEDDPVARIEWHDPSRFVLVGGPGQGKSTLVQHLAQRHRAALLTRYTAASLNYETSVTLKVIKESAETSGVGLPIHPRFPFRVILEQFADALAKGVTTSVLDFIASMIRKRTGRAFERDDAEQLLQQTPCFVAFDGLDEVPVVSNRIDVMTAVRRFFSEARAMDSDLLIVATTRPQGYEDEFSPAYFNHLYLAPLKVAEALDYARKFVQTKYAADADRRERVTKRLEAAASEEATARLMVSPLQVTIMAALVDVVGNPPRERYPLFDRYYEVVYQREQERGIGSSEVLAEHRADINALHDRVGLLLQIATERVGQTESRISGERLRELVRERLTSVGYEGEDLIRITQNLVEVALNRLVFIVPLEEDQYGFEVRSLQEFAAARALMRRGSPEQIKLRLWAIAPVPYWRNTVLFAVGLVFAEREDLSDTVAQLCRELNEDEADPALFHSRAGSRLALDILQDGVVDRRPKHRRSMLETALLLLEIPDPKATTQLALLYHPGDQARYITALRAAAPRHPGGGAGVFMLLAELTSRNIPWGATLLQELWPPDIDSAQWAFEHSAAMLPWDEWQISTAVTIARESHPRWVAAHLAEWVPVQWIKDTQEIERDTLSETRISLYGEEQNFAFVYASSFPSEEALQRFEDAAPIHPAWALLLDAREFIVHPDAKSLAKALGLLASKGVDGTDIRTLPWPLEAILFATRSNEDLQTFADRAQEHLLGIQRSGRPLRHDGKSKGLSRKILECLPMKSGHSPGKSRSMGLCRFPHLCDIREMLQCVPQLKG